MEVRIERRGRDSAPFKSISLICPCPLKASDSSSWLRGQLHHQLAPQRFVSPAILPPLQLTPLRGLFDSLAPLSLPRGLLEFLHHIKVRPSFKMFPPFRIRNLYEEEAGTVQIFGSEYDKLIETEPAARLTFIDEDDGEIITVSSQKTLNMNIN